MVNYIVKFYCDFEFYCQVVLSKYLYIMFLNIFVNVLSII